MSRNDISILIPAYNRAHFLADALNSVLPELGPNDEIIVADDGSEDAIGRVLRPYLKDKRIRFFRKAHTGAPDTKNFALSKARRPWVLWLDSDDRLRKGALKHYRAFMENFPEVHVFYGNLHCFGQIGKKRPLLRLKDYYRKNDGLLADLFQKNCIMDSGTLIRRSVYEQFGAYDVSFDILYDWDFWVKVVNVVLFKHIGSVTCEYRWHEANLTTASVKRDRRFDQKHLKNMLARHPLETLFPKLNWKVRTQAMAKAYRLIGQNFRLRELPQDSMPYLMKSFKLADTPETLKEMARSFVSLPGSGRRAVLNKIGSKVLRRGALHLMNEKKTTRLNHYTAASLLESLGNFPEAAKIFLRLLSRPGTSEQNLGSFRGGIFFHLGQIHEALGESSKAVSFYKKTLQCIPGHGKAESRLTRLLAC